jgi:hypothetical protein
MCMSGGDKRKGGIVQVTVLTGARKGRTKVQGFDNIREDGFEKQSTTVDAIIQSPELRTKG